MKITYIHHSSFLVETGNCYYLFDYEKGCLPELDNIKPMIVLSSHGHYDHYNPEIFSTLDALGMQKIYAVLSEDIEAPANVNVLQVSPGNEYRLCFGQKLTTFQSTDLGVAFLIEDQAQMIMMQHTNFTKKWAVFVMKILQWEFISSLIRMDIGWKSFLQENNCRVAFEKLSSVK